MRNAARIILLDETGRLLLQQRSADSPTEPSKWGFFGGEIEVGEEPLTAAKREAQEELGYTIECRSQSLCLMYQVADQFELHYFFMDYCKDKKSLQLHEGQRMSWVTIDEAQQLDLTDSAKKQLVPVAKALHKFRQKNPPPTRELQAASASA